MLPQRRKAIAKRKFARKLASWVLVIILFLSLSGLPASARNTPADIQVAVCEGILALLPY
ncbi:MAG: hypothetical protein CLLPBCKN_000299 [Chroococcidiopsis cubana SAG 39.79]|uniref:hypothetical protein n=1 Tax=Chroococcidiopsis cubana TaxID=171392 RepID=UPI0013151393|nr:hypothetical protein [Chroococcidiopsis cubana]MDZ4870911.1 hypothetical protein [Chroococcidiopsis cubana SAG 39.79]